MDKEYAHRIQQCREYASNAGAAKLNTAEAWSMLTGRIIPSVTYPMSVTTFTETQCKSMNTIIDKIMINKLRLNRHMPKAVVYAPLTLGGIGYPSFQIIQDQKGILTMLKHFRWNGTVANDMLTVLSAIQLIAGWTTPIFEDTTTRLDYIQQGWFTHQRSRMGRMQATMWIEHQWCPDIQRVHDRALMQAFLAIPNITRSRLMRANLVRIYLRVITIAELANTTGTHIPGHRMD